MAHHQSAKKRIRQTKKRREKNKAALSKIKTLIKKTMNSSEKEAAEKIYKEAVAFIDKSASKGRIHKNNAARKKSALTNYLNKIAVK